MSLIELLKTSLALAVAALALLGVMMMFSGETANNYAGWAVGAGIAFLATGAALTIYGGENEISTTFNDKEAKK